MAEGAKKYYKYQSNYIDVRNDPLYPFGYGLSYTTFSYGDVQLSADHIARDGSVTASVTVTNTGQRDGDEVVQLYIHHPAAQIARPVKELKGFERVFLKSGESRDVKFVITEDDLKFYNSELHYVYEPGEFDVMVGPNSRDVQTKSFQAK